MTTESQSVQPPGKTQSAAERMRAYRRRHRHGLRCVKVRVGRAATSDKATIVIERQPDGKMRVTSGSWDGEKVILRDQALEVRYVDGRLHVARKPLHHDEGNTQIEPYGPMGSVH